jgi:hypothetical protein
MTLERHRRVHPGREAEHLCAPAAHRLDDDAAAVGGVALARDPAAAFEPVDDAGHGGGWSPARRASVLGLSGP